MQHKYKERIMNNRMDIREILEEAKNNKASDIHITVGIPPRNRVHGQLKDLNFPVLKPADTQELCFQIMKEQQIKTLKEVGEVDFSAQVEGIGRYRANVYTQKGAYGCALRTITSDIPLASDLGLPQAFVDLYTKKRGLILVTGPTGSGKSTSLASLINVINEKRSEHILTLEDPIEYVHHHKKSMVNQREVGMDTESYANGLRGALREDPDVILVGEMRDLETISTAITAAETGHLVLSTLHTIGAAATVDRIIDVFPPHQQGQVRVQLGMILEAVISQQLLPDASGHGRVAAFEVMLGNPAIRNLIREGKSAQIQSIIQTNRKDGMITMDDSLFELYRSGRITQKDAITFAQDVPYMEKMLGKEAGSSRPSRMKDE